MSLLRKEVPVSNNVFAGDHYDPGTITSDIANHILWHFNEGGFRPGSFTQRLMEAFAAADVMQNARLASAYPGYGAAFDAAQNTSDGIDRLRAIAKS